MRRPLDAGQRRREVADLVLKASVRAGVASAEAGSVTRIVTSCDASSPGATALSARNVRRSATAPKSSTTDIAIWATMNSRAMRRCVRLPSPRALR